MKLDLCRFLHSINTRLSYRERRTRAESEPYMFFLLLALLLVWLQLVRRFCAILGVYRVIQEPAFYGFVDTAVCTAQTFK